MQPYVLLIRHNADGAAGMIASGADGAAQQVAAVTAYGGSVRQQLATFGRYDVVLVADFPDNKNAAAFCLALTAAGQSVELLPALDPDDVDGVLRIATDAVDRLGAGLA